MATRTAHHWRVITNCTNRKRGRGEPISPSQLPPVASIQELARAWVSKVEGAPPTAAVDQLYVGRAFADAKASARAIEAQLWVVSAGLGLIRESHHAPLYNLTVAPGDGSIRETLARFGCCPQDWWRELSAVTGTSAPIKELLGSDSDTSTLIALPASYLELVLGDLSSLSSTVYPRVRIITSEAGRRLLPSALQPCALPYDERLEGSDVYAGTRTDFPQRALRHFVESLRGHALDLASARKAVSDAMAALRKPLLPERKRMSDDEIVELIKQQWNRMDGRREKLHRYLRDEALVSCEQGRFGGLWHSVKDSLQGA